MTDQSAYPKPSVTVDLVVFTVVEGVLKLLLIQRGEPPFKGHWALPGGFVGVGDGVVEQGESVEAAAHRELAEETGLERGSIYLEQLQVFGKPYRDPRARVITVAWTALVPADRVNEVKAGTDAAEANWFTVSALPPLAFDHDDIVRVAQRRLRETVSYGPAGFELVAEHFTIGELRDVHEALMGTPLDPGNFRRQFLRWVADGRLQKAPGKRKTASKPAQLYQKGHLE